MFVLGRCLHTPGMPSEGARNRRHKKPTRQCPCCGSVPVTVRLQDLTARCVVVQVIAPKAPSVRQCIHNRMVEAPFRCYGGSANVVCASNSHSHSFQRAKSMRCIPPVVPLSSTTHTMFSPSKDNHALSSLSLNLRSDPTSITFSGSSLQSFATHAEIHLLPNPAVTRSLTIVFSFTPRD